MPIIIANWKSNKSLEVAEKWMDRFAELEKSDGIDESITVVIAPSFCHLDLVAKKIANIEHVALASQDLSQFSAGSYTGEISGINLDGFHVKYSILGHSERRRHFRETSNDVAMKVDQAVSNDIIPVVCVDDEYVESQALSIDKEHLEKCVVAYEPLSAIGSGKNEDVGKVKEVVEKIKSFFGDVPVIYGGSVNDMNVAEYLLVCDGVLVGTASLDCDSFWKVVKNS
jgi:triosephosphate isomerase (TIM)